MIQSIKSYPSCECMGSFEDSYPYREKGRKAPKYLIKPSECPDCDKVSKTFDIVKQLYIPHSEDNGS